MNECVNKCELDTNELVIRTVIEKGFENDLLQNPFPIKCDCGNQLMMETFISVCPECECVYGLTPCHQNEPEFLAKVKKGDL